MLGLLLCSFRHKQHQRWFVSDCDAAAGDDGDGDDDDNDPDDAAADDDDDDDEDDDDDGDDDDDVDDVDDVDGDDSDDDKTTAGGWCLIKINYERYESMNIPTDMNQYDRR